MHALEGASRRISQLELPGMIRASLGYMIHETPSHKQEQPTTGEEMKQPITG